MQAQLEIEFIQLLKIIRNLPSGKLKEYKAAIDMETLEMKSKFDLETLLLNGPVATKKEIETIENNRKAINQWRTI